MKVQNLRFVDPAFLTRLSVGAVFIAAADIAGVNAHTTFGKNKGLNEIYFSRSIIEHIQTW